MGAERKKKSSETSEPSSAALRSLSPADLKSAAAVKELVDVLEI